MTMRSSYDAVVVGAGPNGFGAAITLARAGKSVLLVEASDTIGGGMRSAELTLPGYTHDICSTIFSMTQASPFFQSLPLAEYGVEWIYSPLALAHPLEDGTAAILDASVPATAAALGPDGPAYQKLIGPLAVEWRKVAEQFLGPFRIPRHPLVLARLGLAAVWPAAFLARTLFKTEGARVLFAGMACHSMLPPDRSPTAAFGLILSIMAHGAGWPIARGGAQTLAEALAAYFQSLGGEIQTRCQVDSLERLPRARAYLFNVTPQQLVKITGDRLPAGYRGRLARYRYGPGVFKVDWALDAPVPWQAADCHRALVVHLGATLDEIVASENAAWQGKRVDRPYMIVVQPSLFDPTRAPAGKHTLWGYCHVPHGSAFDVTEPMEAQIERFAPGFRQHILARHVMPPAALERHNANYVGGDINSGAEDWLQLFTRPTPRLNPYSTPAKGIYLCSSSTPPGGGVHGMAGYYAARSALRELD